MDKKLGRLLWPSVGQFFGLLSAFAAAAIYTGDYVVAAIEFAVIILTLVLYVIHRSNRKKEIQKYVKERTAPYKYPRIVVFRDELPKTTSGKIQRNKL